MKIKDSNTAVGVIATPTADNIYFLETLIKNNSNFYNEFPFILFIINDYDKNNFKNILKKYIKTNIQVIKLKRNLGHTFGTIDMDNMVHKYFYDTNFNYFIKMSIDLIINKNILEYELNNSNDFYYINNIGYNALSDVNLINKIHSQEYFYPQTNFYIIKNKLFKNLYDENNLLKYYNIYINNKENKKAWELFDGFCSEQVLANAVSEIRKLNMLNDLGVKKLINFIKFFNIHDGSHKNIMYPTYLGNMVHYHGGKIIKLL